MKTLEALSYYWQVLWRSVADTGRYIADQKLVSLTILFLIGLVVYLAAKSWFPSLIKEWGEPMDKAIEFAIFSLISVVIYALALLFINLAATPARMHYEQADKIKSLLPPDGLDLYFRPQVSGGVSGGSGVLQYHGTTITNRSKRNMNLHFTTHIYFTTDSGEKHRLSLPAELNAGREALSGGQWVNVQAENTFVGSLTTFVPEPGEYGLKKWKIDPTEDVVFMAKDTITGAEVYFRYDYPEGRLAELPPAEKTMASLMFKVEVRDRPGGGKEARADSGNPKLDVTNDTK